MIDYRNKWVAFVMGIVQHYNHKSYWSMRSEVINPRSKVPYIVRLWYLYRIKRSDAFNNASMGTNMGWGARFQSPPHLEHGLNGIIVSHYARIGKDCCIMQQVTISQGNDQTSAVIGDNCFIGAGAKILGNVHIGNNVRIGANAVVIHDIASNCTVVGVPAKIIERK